MFIDEIDAIGTKRYESNSGGEREIQRTMLELLISWTDSIHAGMSRLLVAAINLYVMNVKQQCTYLINVRY